jgi:hypothetical protein
LNKRTQAIFIGLVAATVGSGIGYSVYQSNQNQLEVAFRDPENGISVFDTPVTSVNGTVKPLFPDTSERDAFFLTSDNFTAYDEQYHFTDNFFFAFCDDTKDSSGLPLGDHDNPAIVKIGGRNPVVVSFCDSNWGVSVTGSKQTYGSQQTYVLRVDGKLGALQAPEGADYDNMIDGLDIWLNTRTVEMPDPLIEFEPVDENNPDAGARVAKASIVIARVNLYLTANSDAIEGLHGFTLMALEPIEVGKFKGTGHAIFVKVIR